MKTHEDEKAIHLTLADYYSNQYVDVRKVDELPWQLSQAEEWKRLKGSITDLDMFLEFSAENKKYELLGYWLQLGDRV